jgi:hypothetical protein
MSKQPANNPPYSNDEGATVLAQEAGANEGEKFGGSKTVPTCQGSCSALLFHHPSES